MRTEQQPDPAEDYLRLTNLAQLDLMREAPDMSAWVTANSENFRKLIEEDQSLLDLYLQDPAEFKKVVTEKLATRTLH